MENIRQAIDRALTGQAVGLEQQRPTVLPPAPQQRAPSSGATVGRSQEVVLNSKYLRDNRIISHVVTDPLTRPYDMLRTQILQLMDQKKWKILAVTSPTPGCGKTVTALNLALSIARQPERRVLLMDLDFVKPKAATFLGLNFINDVRSVLDGSATLPEAIISTRIADQGMLVVPCTPTTGSAELITSRPMALMFQELKRDFNSHIIVLDMPPILSSDDVISLLPFVDCVLLVVAVGITTIAQIEDAKKHLQSSEVVRVALNKVPEASANYYY